MNPIDPEFCEAEFIDGSWTYCGCPDCDDRQDDDRQSHYETYGQMPDAD